MRHFIVNIVALSLLATPALAENSKCRGLPITAETSPRPDFVCPLAETSGIRPQDSHGEGCFASSRGGGTRLHNAVDLNTSLGVDVLAARAGEARLATNWDPNGEGKNFGKLVIIDHEDGDYTFYAHLDSLAVSSGDCVTAGQKIGTAGYSGNAMGMQVDGLPPHLHFEIIRPGRRGLPVNDRPRSYLSTADQFFLGMANDMGLGIINPEKELPFACIYPVPIQPFCG